VPGNIEVSIIGGRGEEERKREKWRKREKSAALVNYVAGRFQSSRSFSPGRFPIASAGAGGALIESVSVHI